jgi:hypothetical protein
MVSRPHDVCFTLKSGHRLNALGCPFCANKQIKTTGTAFSLLCAQFFISRQAQRFQAVHVFDNSLVALRLQPECVINFLFASLSALE